MNCFLQDRCRKIKSPKTTIETAQVHIAVSISFKLSPSTPRLCVLIKGFCRSSVRQFETVTCLLRKDWGCWPGIVSPTRRSMLEKPCMSTYSHSQLFTLSALKNVHMDWLLLHDKEQLQSRRSSHSAVNYLETQIQPQGNENAVVQWEQMCFRRASVGFLSEWEHLCIEKSICRNEAGRGSASPHLLRSWKPLWLSAEAPSPNVQERSSPTRTYRRDGPIKTPGEEGERCGGEEGRQIAWMWLINHKHSGSNESRAFSEPLELARPEHQRREVFSYVYSSACTWVTFWRNCTSSSFISQYFLLIPE